LPLANKKTSMDLGPRSCRKEETCTCDPRGAIQSPGAAEFYASGTLIVVGLVGGAEGVSGVRGSSAWPI